jgi:drug/metabolite transporter (DMT)-like permease
MTWQLAIIIQQLCEAAYALIYRKYSQKHVGQHFLTLAIMYVSVIVPVGIVWSLSMGGPRLDFPLYAWAVLLVVGLLFALGNGANYVANTKLEASHFSVIYACRIIVTIIAAGLLIGEVLSPSQLPGAVIVLFAALALSFFSNKRAKKSKTRYVLVAFGGALLLGLSTVGEKFLLGEMSLATYAVVGWMLQAMFMALLAHKQIPQIKKVLRNGIKTILLLGALRATAGVCFVTALALSDNAALIASITAAQVVLVAISSYVFLGERRNLLLKVGAAVAASIGVILLVGAGR